MTPGSTSAGERSLDPSDWGTLVVYARAILEPGWGIIIQHGIVSTGKKCGVLCCLDWVAIFAGSGRYDPSRLRGFAIDGCEERL